MIIIMKRQFFSSAFLLFSLNAQSTELSDLQTEDDFLTDIPIIISASRLSQPESEASTAITVITRDMIDASTAKNVPDLLRLVPGFQVAYYDGNIPVVTYHGMTEQYSRRIQVLIDGRSIYTPTFGGVLWASLPITLDEIEQIEVNRGPNASTYGSNSFFAVVSIKTYNAYDTQGNYLRMISGNNNRHQVLYRVGAQTENADYRITFSHRGDDGYDDVFDSNDEDLLKLRLDYSFSNNSQLSYQAGINSKIYNRESNSSSPAHDFTTDTSYHHFKWERTLDQNSSWTLQYYYNHYKLVDQTLSFLLDESDINLPPIGLDPFQVIIDEGNTANRHDIEFNYYYSPDASIRTVSGLSFRHDSVQGERFFNTTDKLTTDISRAFGHIEWRIRNDLILNTGLMIEDHEISNMSYSPRIALIQKLNKQQSLRFSVSGATRAPSAVEESINNIYYPSLTIGGLGICNPIFSLPVTCESGTDDIVAIPIFVTAGDLGFEKIISTEFGYFGDFRKNKMSMNAKIFYDQVSDLIIAQSSGSFENSQGVILTGFEYAATYKPSDLFNLYFTYATTRIEDDNPKGVLPTEDLTTTAPHNSYGLTLFTKFSNTYSGSIEYFNVSEIRWADTINPAEAYDIVNIKLTRHSKHNKSDLKTSLIFRNISGDYNDYNEYRNTKESIMGSRILLDIQLQNF